MRKKERPFVTLFFLPVMPVGDGAEYVECLACGGTFVEHAVMPPCGSQHEFAEAVLRLLILVIIRDGKTDLDEMRRVRQFGEATTRRGVTDDELWEQIGAAQLLQVDALAYAGRLSSQLSARQKELAKRAAAWLLCGGAKSRRDEEWLAALGERLAVRPVRCTGSEPPCA